MNVRGWWLALCAVTSSPVAACGGDVHVRGDAGAVDAGLADSGFDAGVVDSGSDAGSTLDAGPSCSEDWAPADIDGFTALTFVFADATRPYEFEGGAAYEQQDGCHARRCRAGVTYSRLGPCTGRMNLGSGAFKCFTCCSNTYEMTWTSPTGGTCTRTPDDAECAEPTPCEFTIP